MGILKFTKSNSLLTIRRIIMRTPELDMGHANAQSNVISATLLYELTDKDAN